MVASFENACVMTYVAFESTYLMHDNLLDAWQMIFGRPFAPSTEGLAHARPK